MEKYFTGQQRNDMEFIRTAHIAGGDPEFIGTRLRKGMRGSLHYEMATQRLAAAGLFWNGTEFVTVTE